MSPAARQDEPESLRPAGGEEGVPTREFFPARIALRMTAVLALAFMTVATATDTLGNAGVEAFLWGTAVLNVPMAFHPRIPERVREWYVTGTWGVVGVATLIESGLRGGPAIFLVTIGLTGLFFGRRPALAAMALGVFGMGIAGYAELRGWWAPRFGTPGDLFAEWGIHIAFFAFMGAMLALTLAATLARARQASTRARQFALAAEHADRAMFVLDAGGAVSWVNAAFVRTTGLSQADAVGRSLGALLGGPATDSAALDRLQPKRGASGAQAGAPDRAEIVVYPRGGEPLWGSVELRAMGDAPGSSGLLLDVTEARATAELEHVQHALATALSSARRPGEASAALTASLLGARAVLGARVLRETEAGAQESVAAASRREQRAPWLEEAAPRSGTLPAVDAPSTERVSAHGDVPTHLRARFPLEGPSSGVLEVFFSTDVPGRAALVLRIPELIEQLGRHERRLAEQARFEALFDRSPDALVLLDARGEIVRRNAVAEQLWPALDRPLAAAWPAELADAIADATRRGAPSSDETVRAVAWQEGHSDAARELEASVAPITLPEGQGVLVSIRDVTARRAAERAREQALVEVRAALAEREVLLKEIHHRVKNNLQIVSSLLSMQSDREVSSEARAALGESVHRVRSMALIHQKLYGGEDLARVELGSYARTLASELCTALAPTAKLTFETVPTELEVEQAVPCGLILNELVVNALKHGRDARGGCAVRIAIGPEGDRIRIAVSDEGPGMPAGFDIAQLRQTNSLGMRLIAALVRQLGATVRLEPGPGARFVVLLPSVPREPSGSGGWGTMPPGPSSPSRLEA
jgi:PAS domain S-box-containing protein